MILRRCLASAAALAVLWGDIGGLSAAPTPSAVGVKGFDYAVIRQSLPEVLAGLSALSGVPIDYSGPNDILISGVRYEGSMDEILATLCQTYRLHAVFNGSKYLVVAPQWQRTEQVAVPQKRQARVKRAIQSLFPWTSPGSIVAYPDLGFMILRGPQSFVDSARAVAKLHETTGLAIEIYRYGVKSEVRQD